MDAEIQKQLEDIRGRVMAISALQQTMHKPTAEQVDAAINEISRIQHPSVSAVGNTRKIAATATACLLEIRKAFDRDKNQ